MQRFADNSMHGLLTQRRSGDQNVSSPLTWI